MELQTEFQRIKALLDKHKINPKRAFGQNYLIDSDSIQKIASYFDVPSYDLVIEIGPGLGALTFPLSKKATTLLAVDADKDMTTILSEEFKDKANVQIINSPFEHWKHPRYKGKLLIIGNIPYNMTSKLIDCSIKMSATDLGFMIQKEVADKLEYKTGSKNCNALACYLALLGKFTIVTNVPKGSFYPIPKVDSSFIALHIEKHIPYSVYLGLKRLFLTPNKTLENVLGQSIKEENKLTTLKEKYKDYLKLRARQLSPEQLKPIARDLMKLLKD